MKILVVDDNEDFCENLKDILELHSYTVLTAYNALKALDLVETESPQLVIMDIVMPGMDGAAAISRIRRLSPQAPVLVTTAFAREELVSRALHEGAFAYIRKPVDFDQLLTIIKEIEESLQG